MGTVENLVIAGERVAAAEGRTFDTVNPATGDVFRTVSEAGAEDADRAVRAAARAFENKATYDDESVDGPAASFFQGRVRLAWTGTDGANRLNVAVGSPGELAVYGLL